MTRGEDPMANARTGGLEEAQRAAVPSAPSGGRGTWATHLALIVVQIAFGSQAVEGKLAMLPRAEGGGGLAPEALAMARMLGAAIVFQGLEFALRRRAPFFGAETLRRADYGRARGAPRPLTARDHGALFGLSLLGIAINQTLFLLGLRLTTPVSAALLGATIPVFAAILAVLARQERASVRLVAGLILALGGALVLTGVSHVDRGAALVLVNSLSYALYLVLGRGVIQRLGALTVTRWIFTWGAIAFLPLGAAPLLAALADLTPLALWLGVYILVVPTLVAYLANAWALGRSTATLVTIYIYLQPLIAALLAWVQLGQPLARRSLFAAALIVAGVAVVASRSQAQAKAKAAARGGGPASGNAAPDRR
jgi:drug/metabolite transporter (DMT)-like permease